MTAGLPKYRDALALVVGAFALIAAASALALPSSAAAASHDSSVRCNHTLKQPKNLSPKNAKRAVICLVNKQRTERGLAAADRNSELRRAAQRHTRRMRRANCFSHQCSGEATLAGRAARSGYLPCRCSWAIGENIGWGAGRHGSPRRIVKSWMASPGHRRNILTPRFTDLGVGFLHGRPGTATRSAAMYTLEVGDKN